MTKTHDVCVREASAKRLQVSATVGTQLDRTRLDPSSVAILVIVVAFGPLCLCRGCHSRTCRRFWTFVCGAEQGVESAGGSGVKGNGEWSMERGEWGVESGEARQTGEVECRE